MLETYFFSHLQTFASGFNLNSQIAVSNSQLVFPTFEQFFSLQCGMAIVSWGWNLVHRSPLAPLAEDLLAPAFFFSFVKQIILFFLPFLSHSKTASLCYKALRLFHCLSFTVDLLKHLWDQDRDLVLDEILNSQLFSSACIFNSQNWISTRILRVCKHEFRALS